MPNDTVQLLRLAKIVAQKTRSMIPRSSNRSAVTNQWNPQTQLATDTKWSDSPQDRQKFLKAMWLATRSGSEANAYRKLIYESVTGHGFDVRVHSQQFEALMNQLWEGALSGRGHDVDRVMAALRKSYLRKRLKKYHKDTNAVKKFFRIHGAKYLILERLENSAKNAVRYKLGNCGECASLAYLMFMEYDGTVPDDFAHLYDDRDLPDLNAYTQRPIIEKVAASPGDHAFLVINRPNALGTDITDYIGGWGDDNNTIICDPWYYHLGDAFIVGHRHSTMPGGDRMKVFLNDHYANLKVVARGRLGDGHSARFRGKAKYANLNYYRNSIANTTQQLRPAA